MPFCRFYHVYPAHILRGHSIGAARTFARTLHGLDQICTDFARIHTDVHGRTDAARTLHGHFMVPDVLASRNTPAAPVFTFLRRLDDVPGETENGERVIPCRAEDTVVSDVMSVNVWVLAEMRGSSSSL